MPLAPLSTCKALEYALIPEEAEALYHETITDYPQIAEKAKETAFWRGMFYRGCCHDALCLAGLYILTPYQPAMTVFTGVLTTTAVGLTAYSAKKLHDATKSLQDVYNRNVYIPVHRD